MEVYEFEALVSRCVALTWAGLMEGARDENPIGTWTITVKDQGNPEKTGRFVTWSLQLWGECVDPALAKIWAPAEEGQPDEEETGSSTTVSQKPKPTDHLPGDHGEASGEAHETGLGGEPTATVSAGEDIAEPTGDIDEGFFDGVESLSGSSTWLAGAGMIIVLTGAGVGAFFFFRARRKRHNLFGMSNNGEGARGAYAPVSEDVPMGLLERGRRKLGGGGGGAGGLAGARGGSKELYDAFGDGPSDESEDEHDRDGLDERTALRYHDDFLGDDDPTSGEPPGYSDDPDGKGESGESGEPGGGTGEGGAGEGGAGEGGAGHARRVERERNSGSSSSWQDAAEDVGRVS